MNGNWKPAVILIVLVGAIVLGATGNMPSLENVIPDWVAVPALVGALVIIGMAFRDAFRRHPVRTPVGIGLIILTGLLAIMAAVNGK